MVQPAAAKYNAESSTVFIMSSFPLDPARLPMHQEMSHNTRREFLKTTSRVAAASERGLERALRGLGLGRKG